MYQRSPQALFSTIGSDVVALHVERGQAYGMQDVTATVWTMLEEPTTLEAMCDRLTGEYDVERDQCEREVGELIALFVAEGLVSRLDSSD